MIWPPWLGRELALLFVQRGLRSLTQAFLIIIVPIYLARLGFGAIEIGFLFTASAVSSALLTAAVGLLSDRYGRKLFLVLFALLTAIGALIFALSTNFLQHFNGGWGLSLLEGDRVLFALTIGPGRIILRRQGMGPLPGRHNVPDAGRPSIFLRHMLNIAQSNHADQPRIPDNRQCSNVSWQDISIHHQAGRRIYLRLGLCDPAR